MGGRPLDTRTTNPFCLSLCQANQICTWWNLQMFSPFAKIKKIIIENSQPRNRHQGEIKGLDLSLLNSWGQFSPFLALTGVNNSKQRTQRACNTHCTSLYQENDGNAGDFPEACTSLPHLQNLTQILANTLVPSSHMDKTRCIGMAIAGPTASPVTTVKPALPDPVPPGTWPTN